MSERATRVKERRPKRIQYRALRTSPQHVFGALALGSVSGGLLVTQNGINTSLRNHVMLSPWFTALTSFGVGLVCMVCIASWHPPSWWDFFRKLRQAEWRCFLGGVLGPVYVLAAIFLTEKLGFATFQTCAIFGMLAASCFCDTVGFLGIPKRPLTRPRAGALAVLAAAAYLIESGGARTVRDPDTRILYCLVTVGAGGIFPLQACANHALKRHVRTAYRAATVSFAVGTLILGLVAAAVAAAASSGRGGPAAPAARWSDGAAWEYLGGVCGGLVVTANVLGVARFGAAGYMSCFVSAQLVVAFAYDFAGSFGFVRPTAPTPARAAGLALAVAAAVAFQLAPYAYERINRVAPDPETAAASGGGFGDNAASLLAGSAGISASIDSAYTLESRTTMETVTTRTGSATADHRLLLVAAPAAAAAAAAAVVAKVAAGRLFLTDWDTAAATAPGASVGTARAPSPAHAEKGPFDSEHTETAPGHTAASKSAVGVAAGPGPTVGAAAYPDVARAATLGAAAPIIAPTVVDFDVAWPGTAMPDLAVKAASPAAESGSVAPGGPGGTRAALSATRSGVLDFSM
jgi:transporter family-2 protein